MCVSFIVIHHSLHPASVRTLHPLQFCCGLLALTVMFALFYHVTNRRAMATRLKREHPLLSALLLFTGGGFIVYLLGSVLVFLFGICLPTFGEGRWSGRGWGRSEREERFYWDR